MLNLNNKKAVVNVYAFKTILNERGTLELDNISSVKARVGEFQKSQEKDIIDK